jgi:hypothetical protein
MPLDAVPTWAELIQGQTVPWTAGGGGTNLVVHQPRARHSGIDGRSAPRVLSRPWPG